MIGWKSSPMRRKNSYLKLVFGFDCLGYDSTSSYFVITCQISVKNI